MRIYFAGVDRPSFLDELWKNGARNILINYADYRNRFPKFAEHLSLFTFNILLDSGAYTAYSRGLKVTVEEYAEFLHRWKHLFEGYFNLDVIGDFDATWKNQDYLEKQGLNPIPVVHYGTNSQVLRILTRQYTYIGLGGMVPIHKNDLYRWLDDLMYDKNGTLKFPNAKFHGLGLTTKWLLKKFPFYSVDSTLWLVGKRFGEMVVGEGMRVKLEGDPFKPLIDWHLNLEKELSQPRTFTSNPKLF